MTNRPTEGKIVWVTNDGGHHDMSGAEKFGFLVPLTTGKVNIFGMDRLWSEVRQKLAPARRDDYVLTAGHGLLQAVVITEMVIRFGLVRILVFGGNDQTYRVITMNRKQFSLGEVGSITGDVLAPIR